MGIDAYADAVRARIAQAFGDTSDLSEELVNTLCNLYYFAEKAPKQDYGGLSDLQEIHPSKSKTDLVAAYFEHMSFVGFAISHAPELVENLRSMRSKSTQAFEYFEEFTLDLLKYRMDDAQNKSGIRRALERRLRRPNEHRGLARRFRVPWRGHAA